MKPLPGRAIDGQTGKGASRPKGSVAQSKGAKTVRGFIRGVIWGGVLAAGGLAVLSQIAPPKAVVPEQPTPTTAESTAIAPVDTTAAASDKPAEVSSPALTDLPDTVDAAPAALPEPPVIRDDSEGTDDVATAVAPTADDNQEPAESAVPSADAPVVAPPVVADQAPSGLATQAVPMAPEAPSVVQQDAPTTVQPAAPAAPSAQDQAALEPPMPAEPPVQPSSEAPQKPDPLKPASDAPDIARPVPEGLPGVPAPVMPGAPVQEAAPQTAELPPPPPVLPQDEALLTPAPDAPENGAGASDTPITPAPPVASAEPEATAVTGVVTNRLPRIGDPEPAQDPVANNATVAEGESYDPALDETLPPIQRFARAFENPEQKPLFSVLLEDNGADVDRAALAALDLPLTVVIDPLAAGAAERAAIWRANGQEVVMALSGLPEGATPTDVEQSLQALSDRLPEAVAVMDPQGTLFQSDRQLSSQIIAILARQGRGLVTFDQGLNAADQVARREGLAATMIFRRIDIDDASGPAVKRYLDRAVFRAAQEGHVAVIGTLTPDIVAGLMEWSVEGRASSVAMAPISALLAR